MRLIKLIILSITLTLITNISYAQEKADCSKIKKDTGVNWLKSALCKRGSDKLDADGNFKEGTFNILKKLKKN